MTHSPNSIVKVRMVSIGGITRCCSFRRGDSLRDAQQALCALFGQSFPKMKAAVIYEEEVFDEFSAYPFRMCPNDAVLSVVFEITDEMYFFDLRDRRGLKPTLEEEVLWDTAIADGDTDLTLAQWVSNRRCEGTE